MSISPFWVLAATVLIAGVLHVLAAALQRPRAIRPPAATGAAQPVPDMLRAIMLKPRFEILDFAVIDPVDNYAQFRQIRVAVRNISDRPIRVRAHIAAIHPSIPAHYGMPPLPLALRWHSDVEDYDLSRNGWMLEPNKKWQHVEILQQVVEGNAVRWEICHAVTGNRAIPIAQGGYSLRLEFTLVGDYRFGDGYRSVLLQTVAIPIDRDRQGNPHVPSDTITVSFPDRDLDVRVGR